MTTKIATTGCFTIFRHKIQPTKLTPGAYSANIYEVPPDKVLIIPVDVGGNELQHLSVTVDKSEYDRLIAVCDPYRDIDFHYKIMRFAGFESLPIKEEKTND